MALKDVKAFYEKVETDKKLQAKLKAAAEEDERHATARLLGIAAEAGHTFTASELSRVRSAHVKRLPDLSAAGAAVVGGRIRSMRDCCYYAQGSMPGFRP